MPETELGATQFRLRQIGQVGTPHWTAVLGEISRIADFRFPIAD
jgi:hypothetical protein